MLLRWCYAHAWVVWGGVEGCNNVHACCLICYATLMLRWCYAHAWVGWGGVGWGAVITFMYVAELVMLRWCYAHAWVGWGGVGWGGVITFMSVCCLTCDATLMLRSCLGGVGWGGVVTFMYLLNLCCYADATLMLGWGGVGGCNNVHVCFVQKNNLFEATGKRLFADLLKWTQRKEKETSFDIMQHQDVQTRPPENVVKTICFKNGLT